MVTLLPGFRLQEGDASLRGYSGAGGNVLVDGQRPSSKQETLEDILQRIPARMVDHVELIRSGASGVDMQGYALMANIVRNKTGSLRGRMEAQDAFYDHDFTAPRLAAELSYGAGDRLIDLSGAVYREIDDEHGFGRRDRVGADGAPVRIAVYGQPEGVDVREVAGSYRQGLAGGTVRVNGLLKDSRMFADISDFVSLPSPFEAFGTERVHTRATELGLRYDRPLGAAADLEVLGIRRGTDINGLDRSMQPASEDATEERSAATESILRGVVRRKGERLSLEGGIEGAVNILDSHSRLAEDGVDVPLPAANVRVRENRAEVFATATWRVSPSWTVEAGGRFEASKLTQSGDSAMSKSLKFLKPRALATWTLDGDNELRFLAEREVGQLDFADFVSSASLTSNSVTAGNKDLEPDSLWRLEAAWEHRFAAGSLVLTARREAISDLVDHVPVFDGGEVFDAVGNIGDGRRVELEAELNLPLDRYRLKGVTLRTSLLHRKSHVKDPATGERRRISGDLPMEGTVALTHDIVSRHVRWGVNYALAKKETNFKVDEVEIDRLATRVDAFIEYKPSPLWTIRVFGKNLTDTPVQRTRAIYTGLRGGSAVKYVETRVLDSGPYVGLTVQRAFGS
jgi:hypothetical protein